MNYVIQGLTFINTCGACPEQYDVFDKNKNQVGYVRLRWGGLTATVPDYDGETIFVDSVGNDGWAGCFSSKEERIQYLTEIAQKINEWLISSKDD